jgi:hypothetical protein
VRRAALSFFALVLAGCGSSTPPPPAGQARATVQRYFLALSRGDAPAMCRELSTGARKQIADRAGVKTCEEAARGVAKEIDPAFLRDLASTSIAEPRVRGGTATVEVTGANTYVSKPTRATVPLVARDGRWVIRELPDGQSTSDPVTNCVLSALKRFDNGSIEAFWKKQGRASLAAYMGRYCKRANTAGLLVKDHLSAADNKQIERIAKVVVREMIDAGELKKR